MKLCVVPFHNLLTAVMTAGSACALAAGILTPAAQAQTATARATIAGTHPTWANESRRVAVAPVTNGTVSARVYLAGQDPEGEILDGVVARGGGVSDGRRHSVHDHGNGDEDDHGPHVAPGQTRRTSGRNISPMSMSPCCFCRARAMRLRNRR